MIEVQRLVKRYGAQPAVDGISFSVARGEVLGFLGPNGAGKTTTMRILTGALPATEGRVSVAGLDVFDQPMAVKRKVGYLPEVPPLYEELDVLAYLRFVARLKGLPGRRVKSEVERVVQTCGLGEVRGRLIANLSKGFRQRVGLAQALLADPEVLILDEPTIGLDPNQIAEIRGLIRRLAENHTVVLSTHILPEVIQVCQRVLIVHRGRIVADDRLENLTSEARSLEQTFHDLTQE
ncbi:MAG TPA: ATP-binding cassette domain-containing protein [Myxococcota bacterium]|nr:ATP-binding cassette domain-containing protein [Myxococcota bacterium]HRY93502.1 ATP-binding cassette domain-containing protein [Myxococcota bacterium]HSA21945.1 ATP-binding cassette domain-containing protein [Myxococcota bacterium]